MLFIYRTIITLSFVTFFREYKCAYFVSKIVSSYLSYFFVSLGKKQDKENNGYLFM